jgi:hypothetical protein
MCTLSERKKTLMMLGECVSVHAPVCLSASLSPSRSSNTSKVDETRARIRKSTLRSMIAHKKSWLRRETGVWMLIISYGEFPPNRPTQALIKKWPLKKVAGVILSNQMLSENTTSVY